MFEDVDWIQLTSDRDECRTVVYSYHERKGDICWADEQLSASYLWICSLYTFIYA
jgi:hypothetical protein